MRSDVVVSHASDAKATLADVAGGKQFTWLYLGNDIARRESISNQLGRDRRYRIGGLLQDTARQEKQAFLDFIAVLGRYQKNRLYWWASKTAYKSPLASDFFLLWCYAAMFRKLLSDRHGEESELIVVLVEDRWLYRYLWQLHREEVRFSSKRRVFWENLRQKVKGIIAKGLLFLKDGYLIWRTIRLAQRTAKSKMTEGNRGVYLYSEVADRCFQQDGGFRDPNFGRLPQILNDDRLELTFIAAPFRALSLKKKSQASPDARFAFLDQYFSFGAIFRSILAFPKIDLPRELESRYPSVGTLVQHEEVHESTAFSRHLLYYYGFKNWIKQIGSESVIIYPFENQPWEKMLCLAAKESGKTVKLVGYQHSGVSSYLLNFFFGNGEPDDLPLPDVIATNGQHTLDLFTDSQFHRSDLANGGALRFEHLHRNNSGPAEKSDKSKSLMVAFPYSRSLTAEMLTALVNGLQEQEDDTLRVILKPHPWIPFESLGIPLPNLPSHFENSSRPMPEVLKEADLVLYSSSTAGLEAVFAGVPVLKYSSEHEIELDPLDLVEEVQSDSCIETDLREKVYAALEHKGDRSSEQTGRETILNRVFSPVDENTWKRIVGF